MPSNKPLDMGSQIMDAYLMTSDEINERFADVLNDAAAADAEQEDEMAAMTFAAISEILDSGATGIAVVYDGNGDRYLMVPENIIAGTCQAVLDYCELCSNAEHAAELGGALVVAGSPLTTEQGTRLAIWMATLTAALLRDDENIARGGI